jgi:hypothetical protein
MECLIVRQPYASLIAFGKKRWEFRSYDAKKLGVIGIAASHGEPLKTWDRVLNSFSQSFPRGLVLATAELVTSFLINSNDLSSSLPSPIEVTIHGKRFKTFDEPIGEPVEDVKLAMSKKEWESYAWVLDDVHPLEKFVPYDRESRSTWVNADVPVSKA